MSADRPVTSAETVTDDMVTAFDIAQAECWDSHERDPHNRDCCTRAGLAAVVPLIRAQVAAELRTCQETAASLLANDDHLHECEREAGHRSPRHRCPCGCEWWPMVEWERPVITPALPSTVAAPVTVHRGEDFPGPDEDFAEPDEDPADVQAAYEAGEKGVTKRPPGWCRWHEMVDCHGDAPECREARAELDGADPCGDVYADGPPLSRHTCGRPSGHNGAHRCRCVGFENYTWPAGGGDE